MLLQDPVRECEPCLVVLAISEIFEEVGDDFGARVAFFVQYDIKEFAKLNVARSIFVDEGHQIFDLLNCAYQTETDQRPLDLVDANGSRPIVIQTCKALLQSFYLTAHARKQSHY